MLFDILALIFVIITIILLRRLINIFPSLMACTIRWKESINLEASVKHSLDRDMLAAAMFIPFCLAVEKFDLYSPQFMENMSPDLHLTVFIGIFTLYSILRTLTSKMIKARKMSPKIYKTAGRASFTFFIILTLVLLLTGGVLDFIGIDQAHIRIAMLCVSAFIYALFLLRKFQIFSSGCSFFTAFLYLCALEFFPTGVLVASAIIF